MNSQKNTNGKYRILIVLRWLGGIRTFCRYVFNSFEKERFQFTLMAPDTVEIQHLLEDLRELDLKYIPIPCAFTKEELDFRKIASTISNGKFDLIHSQGMSAGVYCLVPACLKGVPHLLTLHDYFIEDQFNGKAGFIKKWVVSQALHRVTTIHCVSNASRDNLLQFFPKLNHKTPIEVIPHGVEVCRFTQSDKRDLRNELGLEEKSYLIGFLGRFMSVKGFRYLMDALKILTKESLGIRPVVIAVNDGGFIREEKVKIKQDGLENHVMFLPFIPNVAPTLKGMDVIVMPSTHEAFGLLAIETMVAGVPFIGSDIPPIREIVEGTPGKLCMPKNGAALAAVIRDEIFNPSRVIAEEYSLAAALRYDVTKQAKSLQKLYLNLINGAK